MPIIPAKGIADCDIIPNKSEAFRANTGPLVLTHHSELPINAVSLPGAEVDLIWEPFVDR